jgi:hypothetical protein
MTDVKQLLDARARFVEEYCRDKGWHPDELTLEQILEIRSQPGWRNSAADVHEKPRDTFAAGERAWFVHEELSIRPTGSNTFHVEGPVEVDRVEGEWAFVHRGYYSKPGEAWSTERRDGDERAVHRVPAARLRKTKEAADALRDALAEGTKGAL